MKGVIYVRVSSFEQVEGTSLDSQEKICRNFCQEKGIEIKKLFKEEGESAKTAERSRFLEAIEYCRKNKKQIDAFVVWKVDRFARNTEDHFAVRKILMDYGVSLFSVTEPIGNDPSGKFMETVLAGAAEFDNAIRRQRSVGGMEARLKQGIYPWRAPLGYKCIHNKKHGEKKTSPDQPDKNIFPIIQRGLKEYSKGLVSQTESARLMDEWGLAEKRGKKTTAQIVHKMLHKNLKFYAGIIVNPWGGEEIKGEHEPMISDDEYIAIRNVLLKKKRSFKSLRDNPDFPLRGTVNCSCCGISLTGSFSSGNGGKYAYYHCYNKECSLYGKVIGKKKIEEDFCEKLKEIKPSKKFLDFFEATVVDLWKEKRKSFEVEVNRFQRKLSELEKKRKRIFEMREDGSYTKNEFVERKKMIENEILATKISLSESNIDKFDVEAVLVYVRRFVKNLDRQWFDLPVRTKKRFQKLIFPEGISYHREEGFGTAQFGLIFQLNKTFCENKSPLVAPRGIEPLFPG